MSPTASERRRADDCDTPRIFGSRGVSQVGATPLVTVPKRFGGQFVEPSLGDVALELSIPCDGVEV